MGIREFLSILRDVLFTPRRTHCSYCGGRHCVGACGVHPAHGPEHGQEQTDAAGRANPFDDSEGYPPPGKNTGKPSE